MLTETQMNDIRSRMANLMQDAIQIEPLDGNSASGPIYGAPASENWKMSEVSKTVTDAKGREVTATVHGLGPYDTVASNGGKVTWDGKVYQVISVSPKRQFAMISRDGPKLSWTACAMLGELVSLTATSSPCSQGEREPRS